MKKNGEIKDKVKWQEAINSVESKVVNRLKQELSFISAYKNTDS